MTAGPCCGSCSPDICHSSLRQTTRLCPPDLRLAHVTDLAQQNEGKVLHATFEQKLSEVFPLATRSIILKSRGSAFKLDPRVRRAHDRAPVGLQQTCQWEPGTDFVAVSHQHGEALTTAQTGHGWLGLNCWLNPEIASHALCFLSLSAFAYA